jgi:Glycosidases
MFMSVQLEDRKPIVEILEQTPQIPDSCQWCLFLRNHDELTLEMVTDIERDYMYDEYAKDKGMRLNLGIRRRLSPMMDNDRWRIQLLNGMLMSMPGTPIIYYGDEIGMGDNVTSATAMAYALRCNGMAAGTLDSRQPIRNACTRP